MKLQIKHYAAYLPHQAMMWGGMGLNILKQLAYPSIANILEPDPSGDWVCEVLSIHDGKERRETAFTIHEMKLILRPLSDFELEEIEEVREHLKGSWCDVYTRFFEAWFDDPANIDTLVFNAPYQIWEYLLSRRYDVFGLLDFGLAINFNEFVEEMGIDVEATQLKHTKPKGK